MTPPSHADFFWHTLSLKPVRLGAVWFSVGLLCGWLFFAPSTPDPSAEVLAQADVPPLKEVVATLPEAAPASKSAATQSIAAADPVIIPVPPVDPTHLNIKVKAGDTMLSIFLDAGATREEAMAMIQALKKVYDPQKLSVSHVLELKRELRPEGAGYRITEMRVRASATQNILLTRGKTGNYKAEKSEVTVERETFLAKGDVTHSLSRSLKNAGAPGSTVSQLVQAFSYDVDFQRQIRPGDDFEVLYEQSVTEDGKKLSDAQIVYAELEVQGKTIPIYRYTPEGEDDGQYFHLDGRSVRKGLLRTPVDGVRISSGYGMRMHPILGYSKMHRGVDFSASTGTPVFAAGDGVIKQAGLNGSYGNYIQLRHNGDISTAYAHLSRYAKGIRNGVRVKQGQVIGYVGTTGRSTGPHLHFEILKNGDQVNPSSMKNLSVYALSGPEMKRFRKHIKRVEQQVASLSAKPVTVASNEKRPAKPRG
jgi:murein DD-endopeptidase MepM/ murein hydrolase activator NlpD